MKQHPHNPHDQDPQKAFAGQGGLAPTIPPKPKVNLDDCATGAEIIAKLYFQDYAAANKSEKLRELGDLNQLSVFYPNNTGGLSDIPTQVFELLPNLETFCWEMSDLERVPVHLKNWERLRELYLSKNKIHTLSNSVGVLPLLEYLDISQNALVQIPNNLDYLKQLKSLALDNNRLAQLPKSIGKLPQLTYLALGFNQLTELPPTIAQLQNLNVLDIQSNQLAVFPEMLLELAGLEELFLANNPFCQTLAQQQSITEKVKSALPNCVCVF